MAEEAKETFDQIADKVFDAHEVKEKETLSESSTEKQPDTETKTEEPATAEVEKTEKVKEVEEDGSLTVEEKIAKVTEILGDDLKAIDAYVKSKGYHNDPAWKAQRAIINRLQEEAKSPKVDEETKGKLELVDKVLSNPSFIKYQMKEEGFTDEAINKKLRELGHKVEEPATDDFQLVTQRLGIDPDILTQESRDIISDVAKVADVIFRDRMEKYLPERLKPLEEGVTSMTQRVEGEKLVKEIQGTVKTEGVLDYDKDIEPELHKFIDENPTATQSDVREHFKKINHELSISRLKTGAKKGERDEKKGAQRNLKDTTHIPTGKFPKRTGDDSEDFDNAWEVLHAS